MVGHDAVAAAGQGAPGRRVDRRVVAGFGVAAVLALAAALLVVLLGSGTASAQSGTDTSPQPYGGALERVDEGDRVTSEQVLEVSMLALGTLNGLAFAVAMVASRLRGPTTAQTRRALITRTGAGVVSESRRERRERARHRTSAPSAADAPVAPATTAGPGGPRTLTPRTPPAGAVPAQAGPAPREGLVPAGRGPQPPAHGRGPHARPGPVPRGSGPHPVPSPPAGSPEPLRPAVRR
ncbi:MAG TPA: hypothetical protein VGH76_01890 [Actinomycetospora sp.]|jgi:hypothetical protein|uniref:hypothetical protein n=1 Tax=Actinomycetospora sp. TaxID=1872135 RepID=UPI002F425195